MGTSTDSSVSHSPMTRSSDCTILYLHGTAPHDEDVAIKQAQYIATFVWMATWEFALLKRWQTSGDKEARSAVPFWKLTAFALCGILQINRQTFVLNANFPGQTRWEFQIRKILTGCELIPMSTSCSKTTDDEFACGYTCSHAMYSKRCRDPSKKLIV